MKREIKMKKENLHSIGIYGFGFVGRAIAHGFALHANISIYDKYQKDSDDIISMIRKSEIIFVAVPTPMSDDGHCDTSIVEEAVANIERQSFPDQDKTIIIKSTVPPGTCRKLQEKTRHIIIFNPEFLTERASKLDFINPARIILGGILVVDVQNLYRSRFPHTPIYWTSLESAEFIKYMCNGFFALKVSFMNECYDIALALGLDFQELKKMFLADMRIGNSHVDCPGHDGQRGFGGKCFPKDVAGIIHWAEEEGLYFDTLKTARKVNDRVRKIKDWEKIPGATIKYTYSDKEE